MTSKLGFSGVPINCIDLVSEQVIPLIEKALRYSLGEYTPQDLLDFCKEQKMQLWVVADDDFVHGCVVTELINYKRKRVCQVIIVSGYNLEEWFGGYEVIEAWARSMGAEEMRSYCRAGWEKLLKPRGFSKAYTVLTKELHDDARTH